MNPVKVDGKRKEPKLFLYTLSTCGWCKKTKEFLKENEMTYEYVDVDKVNKDEQKEVIIELKRRGAPLAFPIIIIDDKQLISGFKKQAIEEAIAK
jgi:glutaredoxin-like protein NrdH